MPRFSRMKNEFFRVKWEGNMSKIGQYLKHAMAVAVCGDHGMEQLGRRDEAR